jgi:hypothetical protein
MVIAIGIIEFTGDGSSGIVVKGDVKISQFENVLICEWNE